MASAEYRIVADGFADLVLEPPSYLVLRMDGPVEGETVKDTTFVDSPFIDGAIPVHSRKRNQLGGFARIEIRGDTQADLEDARDELTDRLDQLVFEVHREIDGRAEAWRCFDADYGPSQSPFGVLEDGRMEIGVSFPVYPVRVDTESS